MVSPTLAWTPPPAPELRGEFAINDKLAGSRKWEVGGTGPEDVVVDPQGTVYSGLQDGRVICIPPSGGPVETMAHTGGRPLGIEIDGEGDLIICDAVRGLLRLSRDGQLHTLVDHFEGKRLLFTNNAAVARDGTIYFTDSSQRYPIAHFKRELLEHSGTGRLFAYRANGHTELLLEGLHFANGVALDPTEQFLLIAETGTYSIRRLWLAGPRAGAHETFLDNLPGFPDNLSFCEGVFWVALPNLRDRLLDRLLPHPWVRKMVASLPTALHPSLSRHGFVLGLDACGRAVQNLQDVTGRVAVITGVRQFGRQLYLGSLTDSAIAVYDL